MNSFQAVNHIYGFVTFSRFAELQQEAEEHSAGEGRSSCGSSLRPTAPLRRYCNSYELAAIVLHTCLPQQFLLFLTLLLIIVLWQCCSSFVFNHQTLFVSFLFCQTCCFPLTTSCILFLLRSLLLSIVHIVTC